MVSRGVKLYEARKRLRKEYDKGKISAREYRQQKAVLDKALEQENIKGLEKLATAPQEKVIGTGQQAAIRTLQQKRIITQQQETNKATYTSPEGLTYKGTIDKKGNFLGVRTVTKREQQLRASERQGFYSIYPLTKEKPKAEILAEQTAIRGSLGIYSPYSLTSDVKFNFEKVETQAPKSDINKIGIGLKNIGSNILGRSFDFKPTQETKISYGTVNNYPYSTESGKIVISQAFKFGGGVVYGAGEVIGSPKQTVIGLAKLGLFPVYWKEIGSGVIQSGKEFIIQPSFTAGKYTGQVLVYKGVGAAFSGLNKAGTRIAAEYQFKFKPADKGIYSKFDYKTVGRYQTGAGQRNLYGRNIGETPSPAGNINKIGFGIEKNTLIGSTNTILPTGQTKLFKSDIVAFNKITGKFNKVKITPNKNVFVYNTNLRKYTEITPDTVLITRNPKYFYSLVNQENIFKTQVSFKDVSTQESLNKFGIKNPLPRQKGIYTPIQKTQFKPSTETPKVFSKGNQVTTFRPQFTTSEVFTKSQYTYPSYSLDVQKPEVPITKANNKLGFGTIALFKPKNITGEASLNIGMQNLKTPSIQSNKLFNSYSYTPSYKDIQLPKPRQLYNLKQNQAQTPATIQKSTLIFGNIQTPAQITQRPALNLKVPKLPKYPTLVGFTPKRQKQPKNSLFKGFNIRQPKAYFPSLRASLLGLKGKRDDDLTGLEERFL